MKIIKPKEKEISDTVVLHILGFVGLLPPAALIVRGLLGYQQHSFDRWFGYISLIVMIFAYINLHQNKRKAYPITLTDEGIFTEEISQTMIHWRDIKEINFSERATRRPAFIYITIKDDAQTSITENIKSKQGKPPAPREIRINISLYCESAHEIYFQARKFHTKYLNKQPNLVTELK